jgi:tRNA(Arg) A34 adenosine deaminase TadA
MRKPTQNAHEGFMREAIRLAQRGSDRGEGGPFGAVIVWKDTIVSRGWNRVLATNDPTAHAEVMAIRRACRRLDRVHLEDCELYSSCEPCPMCLSAIYWARLGRLHYAGTRQDAAHIGFQDAVLYGELKKPPDRRRLPAHGLLRTEAQRVMRAWAARGDRVLY